LIRRRVEGESLEESPGTPSVVSPELVTGGEEGEEFWKKL